MAKTTKKVMAKQGRSDESPEVSPVYFLSLEVENVLCFKDKQVLDLTDKNGNPAQWTVVLGDNGVGKTTLLRCLAGMESTKVLYFPDRDAEKPEEIAFPRLHSPQFVEAWPAFWRQIMGSTVSVYVRTEVTYGANLCSYTSVTDSEDSHRAKIQYSGLRSNSHLAPSWKQVEGLTCYGYGAIRNLGGVSLDESLPVKTSLTLFEEDSFLINAQEWLLQTDYASRTASGEIQARLKREFIQIVEILKRILPDVSDIRIVTVDENNPRPRAEFHTPYGWVHIDSLGLGYRTAIAWMVDLAVRLFRRYPHSPNPLAEPAIVLVDEIDLHLHPRWQRTIMDFLTERFPNTQFIVTAHSPLVVQAAQNANIVLLRREGDRVVIDNDPEIIKNWRVDQVLTSVFELPSSRPPHIEPLLKRHEEILAKAHLTQKDEAELEKLAAQIGPLPTADTPEDIEAMDIIRQAAKLLKNA
jgi:predicted ATP-binding protein involved in virulence